MPTNATARDNRRGPRPPALATPPTPFVTAPTLPDMEPRLRARALYWMGWRCTTIAELLGAKVQTVQSWKRRDDWDAAKPIDRVDSALEARLVQLVMKDKKDGSDYKEIDLLGRQLERTARVRRYEAPGGHEGDLNPKVANRNAGPRRQPKRNHFSEEAIDKLREVFDEGLFGYQRKWFEAGKAHRIRNLLKSRQIGATYYFAREALLDALDTGRNQIFLSASKAQAFQFRAYILEFAKSADVELKGENITLSNDAELIFLGTNSRTAQSYHGNLYLDEYFWIPRYQELRKVASGMASQKRWRQTYFSTPSAMGHEAYPFWTGALYNRGRKLADHIKLDVSHKALKDGALCHDGQWRQIVTLLDAEASGCDLFDVAQLQREYSPDEFAQLFMCNFIDDGASVFGFSLMQGCMVDSWARWSDFKPLALRPMGTRKVWLGYDPSRSGDSAALVVLVPPLVEGGPFRMVHRQQFKGMDFARQAEAIKHVCAQYNVERITIDTSGMGVGVFELVKAFRPDVQAMVYSVESKTRMVMKALDVITKGRLEFDAGWTEVAASFMSIKRVMTASGNAATYAAGRSEETSHADLAWATMQALVNEPFEGSTGANTSKMEIFG